MSKDPRDYSVGNSQYHTKRIQPYDIWEEYSLDPWRADIVKRILRTKSPEDTALDLHKIIHVCNYLLDKMEDKE